MEGTNTMVIPEIIPGILKGNTTFVITVRGLDPRSDAASRSLLSIFESTE